MFLQLLSDDEKVRFLRIARVFSICDNTLLWDGKTEAELTGKTDLSNVSIQESEQEKAILDNFARECGKVYQSNALDKRLIDKLKPLPLTKQGSLEGRVNAASELLSELLERKDGEDSLPAVPKVVLYELMLLALADGEISEVEDALLKKYAVAQNIEDFIYEELLDRAKSLSHEASRAVSLILE